MLERIEKKYSIEEVKAFYEKNVDFRRLKKKMLFDNHLVKVYSQRYELFFGKGVICVDCGVEGKYFYLEKAPESKGYHFNLYAINQYGHEVLMTKDHIVARANGGADTLKNYQTMCTVCNVRKADK